MAIVRLRTNLRQASNVHIQSCLHGIECDVIEAENSEKVIFELSGNADKIDRIAELTGSVLLETQQRVRR